MQKMGKRAWSEESTVVRNPWVRKRRDHRELSRADLIKTAEICKPIVERKKQARAYRTSNETREEEVIWPYLGICPGSGRCISCQKSLSRKGKTEIEANRDGDADSRIALKQRNLQSKCGGGDFQNPGLARKKTGIWVGKCGGVKDGGLKAGKVWVAPIWEGV